MWSVLYYAAGALPITVVRRDEEFYVDYFHDKCEKTANNSMKGGAGLPVGIQVVSYPGCE